MGRSSGAEHGGSKLLAGSALLMAAGAARIPSDTIVDDFQSNFMLTRNNSKSARALSKAFALS